MNDLELVETLLRQVAALNDAYASVFPFAKEPHAAKFLHSAYRAYAVIIHELHAAVQRLLKSVRSTTLGGAPRGPRIPKPLVFTFEKLEADWIMIRDQAELLMSRAIKDRRLKKAAVKQERAARDFALYFWVRLEKLGLATDEWMKVLGLDDWLPRAH